MVGSSRRGARTRRTRPGHQVAAPVALPPPTPVSLLPQIDVESQEARAEIQRVVRERFPDPSEWPDRALEVMRRATFEERARFIGDDGGMDYQMLFWAIQEAESQKWRRFKVRNPSRLNIRPPSVVGIASIPLEFLPPGVVLPRVP